MAKDTEKLIRQLSLISFLMAERRPVTALEIKQDVEGYSQMNDEAFARRFYADRAELDSLGIHLKVDKPAEGFYEAENYSLPPENFYLTAIEFTDKELAALGTSLTLLDGEFAYAEPLKLALQQLSRGMPSPLDAPEQRSVALAVTAGAGGRELSQRLSKIETAIFRRKTILFDYYTIGRDAEGKRKVDPYHLLYRGGQFYLIGWSHERDDVRVFRVSRIRGKVGYSSKAEHDFNRREDFDPRVYATRTDWQLGNTAGRARIRLSNRVDWLAERHFGHAGELTRSDEGSLFETDYADSRQMLSWVLGLGDQAEIEAPEELAAEARERLELVIERHSGGFDLAKPKRGKRAPAEEDDDDDGNESPIRPERFARLVTLAGILIHAAREGRKLDVAPLCEDLQVTDTELRQDIDVLNVVNFGGGSYVLYAEVQGDQIEVDPEPYGDNFARPARLLPLEAKALVAAIDLFGDHLPQSGLGTARDKIVAALGHDPSEEGLEIAPGRDDSQVVRTVHDGIEQRRILELHYYKENEDEFTKRRVEPYKLASGPEGWYLGCYDPAREDTRHFRLDRMKEASLSDETFEPREGIDERLAEQEWLVRGEVASAGVARVWVAPERARWLREERRVVEELADGGVVVELPYGSVDWLVRETLKGVGDLVVLEPDEARSAVADALKAA